MLHQSELDCCLCHKDRGKSKYYRASLYGSSTIVEYVSLQLKKLFYYEFKKFTINNTDGPMIVECISLLFKYLFHYELNKIYH